LLVPGFRSFDRIVVRLDVVQHDHTHLYVLYVAVMLLVLLVWTSF
jgi:hypothetical protein